MELRNDQSRNAKISERCLDTVVCCDSSFSALLRWNRLCREHDVKFIGCDVTGLCGFVFDDFLSHFEVNDVEGNSETASEVIVIDNILEFILQKGFDVLQVILESVTCEEGGLLLQCLQEEKFEGIGIGDSITLKFHTKAMTPNVDYSPPLALDVTRVDNTKTVHCSVQCNSSVDDEFLRRVATEFQRGGGRLKKNKKSLSCKHSSLADQLQHPSFSPSNACASNNVDKAWSHCVLAALIARGRRPRFVRGGDDAQQQRRFRSSVLSELVRMGMNTPLRSPRKGGVGADILDAVVSGVWRPLTSSSSAIRCDKCPATVSVVGSMAAQEAIKSLTHVHCPVNQFFMFESFSSLTPVKLTSLSLDQSNNNFKPKVFSTCVHGDDISRELACMRVLVVGAGAIGSELLKNLALMGCGSAVKKHPSDTTEIQFPDTDAGKRLGGLWSGMDRGGVVVVDMDHVERSNLNRQLLFRNNHIGKNKATVAAKMIKKLNPFIRVRGVEKKISADTEDVFNSEFWSSVDVVLSAVDNIEARRFVDSKCVRYGRWFIDAGTLGISGSTQVVIPFLTESYSSTSDPPESSIPLCTVKSFPYLSAHCVAWAKLLFDQHFNFCVAQLSLARKILSSSQNSMLSSQKMTDSLLSFLDSLDNETAEFVLSFLEQDRIYSPTSSDILREATRWSLGLFDSLFNENIRSLLLEHPSDEIDDDGVAFWGRFHSCCLF